MSSNNQTSRVDSVEFALALHRRFAKAKVSVLLSPVSISLALRPLRLGARGDTAAGIQRVLDGGEHGGDGVSSGGDDPDRFLEADGKTLSLAIGLWLDKQFEVDPSFADAAKADRRVHWFEVDFAAAEAVRERINGWTEKLTKGRISNLLSQGSTDSMTRLVSTSAVHFHDKWRLPFEKKATTSLPLTRADGTRIPADMMRSTMSARLARGKEGGMPEREHRNGHVFYALLPDSPSDLGRLEAQLTPTALSRWIDSLESREVDVWLPRFRHEAEYDLGADLSALGSEEAFDPSRADFSGIGTNPGRQRPFLSNARH